MMKKIYNMWKTNKSELVGMLIILLGSGVAGMLLMALVSHVEDSKLPFMTLGVITAVFALGIVNFIFGLFGYQNTFDLIVSMGCRRKDYMISQIAVVYINMLLEFGVIGIVYGVEKLLHRFVYTGYEMFYILKPKMMLMLFLLIPALRLLLEAIIRKYKKKAFWIIWTIWILGSCGSGKIISYLVHHPQNWLWVCISTIINLPGSVQMMLVLLLTIVMLSGMYLLTKKQAVYV